MNRDPSEFNDPLLAEEWRLQEQAREDERAGRPAVGAGARLLRYRLIARELYQPLHMLPDTMPGSVAAGIEQEAALRHRSVQRFRFWSLASPLLVFAASILILTTVYGTEWLALPVQNAQMKTLLNPWLLVLAGCGAFSRLLPISPRRRVPGWN